MMVRGSLLILLALCLLACERRAASQVPVGAEDRQGCHLDAIELEEVTPERFFCPQETKLTKTTSGMGEDEQFCEDGAGRRQGPYLKTVTLASTSVSLADDEYVVAGHFRDGLEHGLWTERFSGVLMSRGRMACGMRDGEWHQYHRRTGELLGVNILELGKGHWRAWGFNGELSSEGPLVDDVEHGGWTYYHSGGESVRVSGEWVRGEKHGQWTTYDEGGNLIKRTEYMAGREHGTRETFFASGALESRVDLVNGKEEGPFHRYHESGEVAEAGDFDGGLRVGQWTWYSESGQVTKQGEYIEGAEDGLWIEYFDDGVLGAETTYENGKRNGWHMLYWPNGNKRREGRYVDNVRTGTWCSWTEAGVAVEPCDEFK